MDRQSMLNEKRGIELGPAWRHNATRPPQLTSVHISKLLWYYYNESYEKNFNNKYDQFINITTLDFKIEMIIPLPPIVHKTTAKDNNKHSNKNGWNEMEKKPGTCAWLHHLVTPAHQAAYRAQPTHSP